MHVSLYQLTNVCANGWIIAVPLLSK